MNELEQLIKEAEEKGLKLTFTLSGSGVKFEYPPLKETNIKQVLELINRNIEGV